MKLVAPSVKYQQSYLEAIEESKDDTSTTVLSKPEKDQSFEQFVSNKIEESKGLHLPEGFVPATELWLVDNDEFIGRASIRHELTDDLLKVGGHIGYWVRPSKRGKGYGKALLKMALLEAKKLGLSKALITCDETNTGSCKIIESNGGVLENIIDNGDKPRKKRFWIELR